jgi:DNA polymerase-3 subunit alpha
MYLNCHSYYSFRYGTLSPEALIDEAQRCEATALALTDINNTSGCFDFIRLCQEAGIKPIIGMDIRNGSQRCYVALAHSMDGFENLNRFASAYLMEDKPFPAQAPKLEQVSFIYTWGSKHVDDLSLHEYLGVTPEDLPKLRISSFQRSRDKLVLLNTVTFKDKVGFNTHRLLRAIDCNTLLSKLSFREQADEWQYMRHMSELRILYHSYPEIWRNTEELIDRCEITFDFGTNKNKLHFTGSRESDRRLIRELTDNGLKRRYGSHNAEARARAERELQVIAELGFESYFLITWDIIREAQSRGFWHVGRGSGANSLVAYCLELTDVDPIELDLYFERFINLYRSSPPDFDIDFSWQDRDEVTQYIFDKYGHEHTALLANYSTFKDRSTIRELGKVFGLPKPEIDEFIHGGLQAGDDKIKKLILRYARRLEGFPNHLSIHAGGVLITEQPIYRYTATELPPKGFALTQFNMYVAEDIGIYKYDILSQRGLGHLRDAADLVKKNRGIEVNLRETKRFKEDPKLNELLKVGNTIGCFYIESPAMRQLLRKLECEDYLTLVAASSIIRPGVARSGMMRQYIENYHAPEKVQYIHPKMKELMEETYGIMVYQEDVIKVAHHFAGITMAEADVLRRGMSGKYRSKAEFEKVQDRFFECCAEKGHSPELAAEVWRQIESFSGYSFSKAHSASYAVESYQSLYLKAYFPLEFMTAVVNNFGGFYSTEFYLNEARKWGGRIQAPCINHSELLTTIEGRDIYLGFIHLKDLERKVVQDILKERTARGPFESLDEFCDRLPIHKEQLQILIRIGAFRFTERTKKELYWEAAMLQKREQTPKHESLFRTRTKEYALPVLEDRQLEEAYDQIDLLGFPVCNPFYMLDYRGGETVLAADLQRYHKEVVRIIGYYVTSKPVRTVNRQRMFFGTFLDGAGDDFDTVHFPPVVKRYPFRGAGFYLLQGKVVDDFGVYSVEVDKMEKLGLLADPRAEH